MSIKKKLQLSLAAGATMFAFSAVPLLGTFDSTSMKVEASQVSYLTNLDIATSGDNYVVSYTLANVTPSGTVHLNIMNQRGQQIKSIGAINKPQKKGTYTFVIAQSAFKKGDGIIVEYREGKNKLSGLAMHIINPQPVLPSLPETPALPDFSSALDLSVTTLDDDYIVTYTLNKLYEGATVHLEIMNQRGQIIKTIGVIEAPTETGTQKYTISKAEFQKNDGIIVEYRTKDGQVLTGLAQHIINPKTEPSTGPSIPLEPEVPSIPTIPLEPETPELPDFSNAFTTLKFTASGENYIITYALTEVYKDATMHLEIMNQRGQIIKKIGVIGAPTEAGTQKYIISKAEFQKGDGVIMEYKTNDGQILTGAAKHIIGL